MELSVRKDIRHRYLVISNKNIKEANYKAKMILNNKLEGFASCFCERVDDDELFYYEIPFGFSQLSTVLETEQTDERIYKALFSALANALQSIREYLLDADGIILNPDGIFFSSETKEICFVYFPYSDQSFDKSCVSLSENLLHNMNTQDKTAVDMGYRFYRSCVQGTISSEFLREMAVKEQNVLKKEEQYPLVASKHGTVEKRQDSDEDDYSFLFGETAEKKSEKEKKRKGLFGIFRRKKKDVNAENIKQKNEINENFEFGESSSMETVLLKRKPEHEARAVLIQKDTAIERKTELDEDVYLIGQSIAGADIEIEKEGISRLHARLVWKKGRYCITDLGSRNGSCVNGEELRPGELFVLENEDEIKLADIALTIVYL